MAVTKRERLLSDGYELVSRLPAGVPLFVWVCDLELIHDRHLGLTEETLLRLIEAGIVQRDNLSQTTGLDLRITSRSIVNLLERNALQYDRSENLQLSAIGKNMLLNAKARVQSLVEGLHVRHDPYTDQLSWHKRQQDFTEVQLRASKRYKLGGIASLNSDALHARYREFQNLVDWEGLPDSKGKHGGKVEVLRVTGVSMRTIFRPMDLDVWYRRQGHEFDWVLSRGGIEESDAIDAFERAQADGITIIPQEMPDSALPVPELNESIHEVAETISKSAEPSNILRTLELRDAIRQAFEDAENILHIISPWLNQGAIDADMTTWITNALEQKPSLRLVIGYGIDQLPDKPRDPKDARAHRALHHLEKISARHGHRIELREIGNTHEKIIVVDDNYAYIGSFNWLSFNPKFENGPGIRNEIGYRITAPHDIQELLKHLQVSLENAPRRTARNKA